jgi:DNA-binding protein HU-beta
MNDAVNDPLVQCLMALSRHHGGAATFESLVSGLPLEGSLLTPSLFHRAASRIGFTSNIVNKLPKQISAAVAEANGITKKEATDLLANLADLALKSTKKTGAFTFPGIGKLKLVNRPKRMGRNPATGEQIQIPAKTVVKFAVAKAAKDFIAS